MRSDRRRGLGLAAAAAVLAVTAVLAASCGSDDWGVTQESAMETPRSERVEREASIMQQQESSSAEVAGPSLAPSVIDFGHREGIPFTRNVVGDPDAPVLIVEYSDFQ